MPASDTQLSALGGYTLSWLLAGPVHSFTSKSSGKRMTVVELRDPQRLSNSVSAFIDGEAGPKLEAVAPRTVITLHVEELRPGRGRGELIATVERSAVEAAFERAGRSS